MRLRALSKIGKGKERETDLAIVNIYAPTTTRSQANSETTESLYHESQKLYSAEKKAAASASLAGDFNSKVGKRQANDGKLMGKRVKGERSESSDVL